MPRTGTGKRKKTTTVVEEIPEGQTGLESDGTEPSEFDVTLEGVEDAERLQEILEQFGETSVLLKILKKTSTGDEFCYQTSVLPPDEPFIQSNYGGGDYTVRIFINGKYRKSIPLKIAAPKLNPGMGTVAGSDTHSQFLEKLVLAMVSKESVVPQGPSIVELTQALAAVDALRGKQDSALDMLLKGVQLSKEMSGDGSGVDWKTELIRTAKDALPAITDMIGSRNGTVSGTGAGVATGSPVGGSTSLINTETKLKMAIGFLKKKAIAGVDPGLIIDWVVANAEEPDYQLLIHAIFTNEFDTFAKIDPEIATGPFMPWFKQLFDGLRSAFTPENPVDDDSRGDRGNAGNPGNDGKSRTGGSK